MMAAGAFSGDVALREDGVLAELGERGLAAFCIAAVDGGARRRGSAQAQAKPGPPAASMSAVSSAMPKSIAYRSAFLDITRASIANAYRCIGIFMTPKCERQCT
jgi:hypothetical protein